MINIFLLHMEFYKIFIIYFDLILIDLHALYCIQSIATILIVLLYHDIALLNVLKRKKLIQLLIILNGKLDEHKSWS